ncbi:NADP-dependent oxidoreductase domain-containing protein [Amylostereum chailletii]|nr:NADP-dependent oxidoreductase domain-containing protein [Amylostereum chailletii]
MTWSLSGRGCTATLEERSPDSGHSGAIIFQFLHCRSMDDCTRLEPSLPQLVFLCSTNMATVKAEQTSQLGGNAKDIAVLKTAWLDGNEFLMRRRSPRSKPEWTVSRRMRRCSLTQGGTRFNTLEPDVSPEGLKRSVDFCVEKLRGTKKIDLFQCARVDRSYPLEEQMKVLEGFIKEGKFDCIGLSEASAATVREANAVVPIAAVEIEVSPWSYTQETKDVITACAELDIAVVAYSPLGRGLLTGKMKPEDLEEGDYRRNLSRFKDENFEHNSASVAALTSIAAKKGITTGQLCLAWVSSLGPHVISIPGSSNYKRTLENILGGDIVLSSEELSEINKVLETLPVKGHRIVDDIPTSQLRLWG